MPAKNQFLTQFFYLLLSEATLTSFFKDKKSKRVTKYGSRNQGFFSYYFCMMIEGSGSRAGSGSGSIPLTSGSGSGRPKNMWIRWIRIRISNTALEDDDLLRVLDLLLLLASSVGVGPSRSSPLLLHSSSLCQGWAAAAGRASSERWPGGGGKVSVFPSWLAD
jgi:hypothetical protein